jgi:enoyl-CoA hydratase
MLPEKTPIFEFLSLQLNQQVLHLQLARPHKANAINREMWFEIGQAYNWINQQDNVHVVVLSGQGKQFTSGADINFLTEIMDSTAHYSGDKTKYLKTEIVQMQNAFSAVMNCSVPTIAAIHGVCIGGGIDLISACDIRLASMRCYFSIMETKLGIPTDMGTLQRLHTQLPEGRLRELAFTSAIFSARKAKKWGIVNETYLTQRQLMKAAFKLASRIAALPSYAVKATKNSLNLNTAANVSNGLKAIAEVNSMLLQSDIAQSTMNELKEKMKMNT